MVPNSFFLLDIKQVLENISLPFIGKEFTHEGKCPYNHEIPKRKLYL